MKALTGFACFFLFSHHALACNCETNSGSGFLCEAQCRPAQISLAIDASDGAVVDSGIIQAAYRHRRWHHQHRYRHHRHNQNQNSSNGTSSGSNTGTPPTSGGGTTDSCYTNVEGDRICPQAGSNTPSAPAPSPVPAPTAPSDPAPTPPATPTPPAPTTPVNSGNAGTAYEWPPGFECGYPEGATGFDLTNFSKHLYVSPSGSDSNAGTKTAPFKTIVKASQAAVPGTVVHVAPGTYSENLVTNKSGTASAGIAYVSDIKWGAKIIAPNTSASSIWTNHGSYVTISGFEIDGSTTTSGTFRIGIYSDGTEITYRDNHVHNVGNKNVCASNGGAGLNSDASKMGVNTQIYNNVIHNIGPAGCGTWYHGIYLSTSGTIKNNIVYANVGGGIHMWHDATRVDVINNTTFANGFGIIVGSNGFFNKPANPGDYFNVMNNIVANNTIQGISEQGTTGTHNLYKNNLVWNNNKNWQHQNGTVDTGTINADPQFVNAAAHDFHLKESSPAIDSGVQTYAPALDIEGNVRPQGDSVDIGAYESGCQ